MSSVLPRHGIILRNEKASEHLAPARKHLDDLLGMAKGRSLRTAPRRLCAKRARSNGGQGKREHTALAGAAACSTVIHPTMRSKAARNCVRSALDKGASRASFVLRAAGSTAARTAAPFAVSRTS